MNLEQQRNESQRKLNEVSEELNRQKRELELIPVSYYLTFVSFLARKCRKREAYHSVKISYTFGKNSVVF